ncbi:hypothetical protein KCTCHS21_29700 [Cohnella abietis]|uniref:Mannitol-1-phosphate 5-dehydrogenase n=2 Tax=Cohnella abietis TaxID=2507935 RepID=A0A3T1D672_9BACL|nr:hypothetical protein KCTCHS21_29700 [Cohnella abietis]
MSMSATNDKKAVIIGAGQTGRGFTARMVASSDYRISFIDTSEELVSQLNEDGAYTIHYYNKGLPPVRIANVSAYLAGTEEAVEEVATSRLTFTAIGESNLPTLVELLVKASLLRKGLGIHGPLNVITCENGTAPGNVLRKALKAANSSVESDIIIAESAIFCTTVNLSETRLDILSENYPELPYDGEVLTGDLGIPCLVPTERFPLLLQRKIFTYNCISACVTYLGAFKAYDIYAEAANDPDVSYLLDRLAEPLNQALSVKLGFDLEDQHQFSKRAVAKFSDYTIVDYVDKNARDVARKLGPTDRLIAPAQMILETGGDPSVLALVIAAALHYAKREREASTTASTSTEEFDFAAVLMKWSGLSSEHPLMPRVTHYYDELEQIGRGSGKDWTKLIGGI